MRIAFGISWGDGKEGKGRLAMAVLMLVALLVSPPLSQASYDAGEAVSVIIQKLPGSGSSPEQAVESLGGSVGTELGIINGFEAEIPRAMIQRLEAVPGIKSVVPNGKIRLFSRPVDNYPSSGVGSLFQITKDIGARALWKRGVTGEGVDVALIDTGVVPVNGLTVSGKVVNGADVSFEASADHLRHLDTYGHGTHMAGIIGGLEDGLSAGSQGRPKAFQGVAPGAGILNVKVANAMGAADVSQVIAALDWVVQHRNDNGLNVRVINLSFGTDGVQDYTLDPLAHAAEVAWRRGIVVVVAGGNSGFGSRKLNNPAHDPYLLAVGANDTKGTSTPNDDEIPEWSAVGNAARGVDLVAPGRSVVSLRSPGSHVDQNNPGARVGDRFFKGSGTSQAAAVVSGAAALLIDQRPDLTPDQVKALLTSTAVKLPNADPVAQGAGMLDVASASKAPAPDAVQTWPTSTGTGSLEEARGSVHIVDHDGNVLEGEQDIFGQAWDGLSWSGLSWSGLSWSGGTWNGSEWTGSGWEGLSWSGLSWSGLSWSGLSWSGLSWSGLSWSENLWEGLSWSGLSWSGLSWSGLSWSGGSWPGLSWSGLSWSTADWED